MTSDEEAIRGLLFSYARTLDEKNWQGFADLYADEGELVLPWGQAVPKAEIAQDTQDKLGRFAATHHMSANQQIEVSGAAATSRSYVQATHLGHDKSLWILGGRYDNEYRRAGGLWRFARVRLGVVWEIGAPPQFG